MPRRRSYALTLLVTTWLLASSVAARAERADRLFAGPELSLRVRDWTAVSPRYELSFPHGIASPHVELVARIGVVLPARDAPLVFPLTVGMRYLPFTTPVRPLLGADLGGYFGHGRGPRQNQSPSGPEWTWSMRVLAGGHVALGAGLALRVYGEARWAQTPEDARLRSYVFSSLGFGCELSVSFAPPDHRLFDMLMRGSSAPEGW